MGMWVGRGRKARAAYGFEDEAVSPAVAIEMGAEIRTYARPGPAVLYIRAPSTPT